MSNYPGPPSGRLRSTPTGDQLVIERHYRAPIEDVWASLTEADRLARWYGTMDGEPRPGQTVMITLTAEGEGPAEPVRIIECEPPTRFVVETGDPDHLWRLHLGLAEVDGVTTMTFVHELIDGVDPADVGPGWEFYADRLDAARTGNDMPDWDADRYRELLGPHYGNGQPTP